MTIERTAEEREAGIMQTRRKIRLEYHLETIRKAGQELLRVFRDFVNDPMEPWLYSHSTLAAYCADVFGMSAGRVSQLKSATSIQAMLMDSGDAEVVAAAATMTESQLREVAKAPPEKRVEVVRVARAAAPALPARAIRQARGKVVEGVIVEPQPPACCPSCKRPF